MTLQPGHEVKALLQRQDAPNLQICISMRSGTLHSFLDPYPPVGSCHTSTELPFTQSSLVRTPPRLSRDACPQSDPSVPVRIPNPAIRIPHSRSRNSHPRSEDPRPRRTRSRSIPIARQCAQSPHPGVHTPAAQAARRAARMPRPRSYGGDRSESEGAARSWRALPVAYAGRSGLGPGRGAGRSR